MASLDLLITSFFSILFFIFWILLKLLNLDLWLALLAAIIFTCLVTYVLLGQREFRSSLQQIGEAPDFSSSCFSSSLVFAHRERVKKRWGRWLRLVLVVSFLAVWIELSGFDVYDPLVNNGINESVKSKLIKAGAATKKTN